MSIFQKTVYDPFHGELSEKIKIEKMMPVTDDYGNIKYIIYLLKKTQNDGSVVEFYKAVSFFKLQRVAKESKENKKFMEIHTDIMRALYNNKINFVEIIANILKPEPHGLIFLYGVQAIGDSIVEATRKCENDFKALLGAFMSTHRTAHIGPVPKNEMSWIFNKISKQSYTSVLKGIPARRLGSGDTKSSFLKAETSTEEQIEQFLVGLEGAEYCLMLMAQAIDRDYLQHWYTKSLVEATKWNSQKQGTNSLGLSVGIPISLSMNNSQGTSASRNSGTSENHGTSTSSSHSTSNGTSGSEGGSSSTSSSHSTSSSESTSTSNGTSSSESHTDGTSSGKSGGVSGGFEFGSLAKVNVSGNWSSGTSTSDGTSTGTSYSESASQSSSASDSTSSSSGSSWSNGWSSSESDSTGSGTSDSKGTSSGSSAGTSTSSSTGMSTGLNFGFNMSKSYQWVDKTVEYICEILEIQNNRLKSMINGDGGFFVDVYISTEDEATQKMVSAVSDTAWINPEAAVDILRTEVPSREDQIKLSLHMQAMSPCMEIVPDPDGGGGYYYKYCSILASSEFAAYCHPPRVTIGGIDNSMEDIPALRVPTDRQDKEIYVGKVMTGTRFSYEQACKNGGVGYMTDYRFTIGNNELHHAFISGQSRSGKSVLASRLVLECYKNAPYVDANGVKKRKRIFVLDPKGEWRQMASQIPAGKFRFYSIGRTTFHPLKMNLLRVPKYVTPYNYQNLIVEHFCSGYGLAERGIAQIKKAISELYKENDVFGHDDDPFWANEHSKDITLVDVYDKIKSAYKEAQAQRNNHDAEALYTYLTRLEAYNDENSNEYIMFCVRGGASCDSLLGEDEFTVIEANGMSREGQKFFFILFMNAVYESALARGPKGFYTPSIDGTKDENFETIIVLEEANSILISAGKDDTSGQQSIQRFNEILDKSASLGLFIWTITQKIASMPNSVIANSGIIFVGRSSQEDDAKVVMSALGFDERFNVDMKRFIPRLTTGCFIVKVSKGMKFEDQTPTVIRSAMLKLSVPSNQELDIILQGHELERQMKSFSLDE